MNQSSRSQSSQAPTAVRPRILIGVDFSEYGRAALDAGVRLAKDLDADVLLVHALATPKTGQGIAGGALQRDLLEAKAEMQEDEVIDLSTEWAREARAEGVEVETLAEEGEAHEVLIRQAREQEATMIVVGSHGRTGLRRVLLGSVAEQVLRHSDRPVLVVPVHGKD